MGTSSTVAGPLHDAAKNGDLKLARQLLDQGTNPTDFDSSGEPALLIASLAGHEDIVAFLLDNGVSVESRNKGGLTALHAAAYAGNLDVVKLLVSKKAPVNDDKNFYHMSPLHAAAEEGHAEVVAFLLANKADIEAQGTRTAIRRLPKPVGGRIGKRQTCCLKLERYCQAADIVGEPLYNECLKRKATFHDRCRPVKEDSL